ncbi:MAG TPA: hypothetical protein VGD88_13825 [Opitutaceae bacterium]
MTLVEVSVALTILSLVIVGAYGALLVSRRLTEGSIYQNSATTIVQGYIEQMKNMEFTDLPYYTSGGTLVAGSGSASNEVPTKLDEVTPDVLNISSGNPPALSTITPGGTAPTGVVNNAKVIDINQSGLASNSLQLKLWVWIQDVSDASFDATQVRAITIIYHWRTNDGAKTRWFLGTVRTIRSTVPTH